MKEIGMLKEMIYQKERKTEVIGYGKIKGRKWYILNLGTHPTAYVELKPSELLKSTNYNDYDLSVHGGFTFLDKAYWDKEDKSTYIGWDYAHCDDYMGYDDDFDLKYNLHSIKYTSVDILNEVYSVIKQLNSAEWVDETIPHYVLRINGEAR